MSGQARMPDFIIGGAPKCATTSVRNILACHKDIGIPRKELHFFDADDPITHPDFFFVKNGELSYYSLERTSGSLYEAYSRRFEPFADRKLIGEDSTTYLLSEVAADRIKQAIPHAKMVFMIRDPVRRAYSQYWHLVRTARVSNSFERAILKFPNIIMGSTYASGLRKYISVFGRDNVKILLFEEFLKNRQKTIDDLTAYLGVESFDISAVPSWSNRTFYPAMPNTQLALNHLGKVLHRVRYENHLGSRPGTAAPVRNWLRARWDRHVQQLFLRRTSAPEMRPGTRAYLARHLSERNRGLSDILSRDLSEIWPDFTG